MEMIVERLIQLVRETGMRIKRPYLDKGFFFCRHDSLSATLCPARDLGSSIDYWQRRSPSVVQRAWQSPSMLFSPTPMITLERSIAMREGARSPA